MYNVFIRPDPEAVSPTRLTVSGNPPTAPSELGDTCQYVQMKGGSVGANCTKGGMSCERKCEYQMEEAVCVQEYRGG